MKKEERKSCSDLGREERKREVGKETNKTEPGGKLRKL